MALILAALYLSYFHNLGAVGLVGPDEPRYAWIARDMMETGDWVTPRLYGKPWFENRPSTIGSRLSASSFLASTNPLPAFRAPSPRCSRRSPCHGLPGASTAPKLPDGSCFSCPPPSA